MGMSAWIRNMASGHHPGWAESSININYYKNLNQSFVVSRVNLCWIWQRAGNQEMSLRTSCLWNSCIWSLGSAFGKRAFFFFSLGAWHKRLSFSKDDCSRFWKLDPLKRSRWKCKLWAHWQALTSVFWLEKVVIVVFIQSTSEVKCTTGGLIYFSPLSNKWAFPNYSKVLHLIRSKCCITHVPTCGSSIVLGTGHSTWK